MIGTGERAAMDETVRGAIADALARGDGADVDGVLAGLAWLEILDGDRDAAIEIVFRALGAANATATPLDDVLASALGHEPRADLAVLLPRFAAWQPPGRIADGDVEADGVATARVASAARQILVVCGTESEPWSVVVPTNDVEAQVVRGVDPESGLRAVRARGMRSSAARLDAAAWCSAVALGRRAVAHQIEGACRAMLDLARSHAMERVQFGRPIARFQAVRHRLADTLVAVEALEAALAAAREQPSPETAALAKAIAGRTAQTVARHCQQVLAGIGFTTDHRFHRYLKRTMALEGLLGSADAIVLDVGRRLLADRRVPTLIEL
ncbi:MAG TPA: acyl-CoA dehydrogenase family protein [Candidatus Binatia bacterium]|nr:acyl-CoA dehydrogenase family protein [Candidatus Binatia bacterium]